MKRLSKYEKLLGQAVTEKMMDHELSRFIDMNNKQLMTRLAKVKSCIKLEAIRQMAIITKKSKLYYAAKERLDCSCAVHDSCKL